MPPGSLGELLESIDRIMVRIALFNGDKDALREQIHEALADFSCEEASGGFVIHIKACLSGRL